MRRLTRLARMSGSELRFRTGVLARSTWDRARIAATGTRWSRAALAGRLTRTVALEPARRALRESRWMDAHRALADEFLAGPPRFVIHPEERTSIVRGILTTVPGAAADAASLAEPLLTGRRRLLGYDGLDFGNPPDWHLDPVHHRRSSPRYWADVPFLDSQEGDHKVIWELNRHQHWLQLGRACWLTGTSRYRDVVLAELRDWLDANPPLMGINWTSMLELAFRCLSWTWALHFFLRRDQDEAPWLIDLLLGLDRQLAHIERNLSYYFSPNTHLSGEGLALYVCGHAFPALSSSARRVALGRAILLDALRNQVEDDGGHRERSTHYHRYTLDFYVLALAIARITGDSAAEAFASGVERLATAARLLADDTGGLPHIGDDDGGLLFPICGRDPARIEDSLSAAAVLTGCSRLAIAAPPEEVYWLLSGTALCGDLVAAAEVPTADPPVSAALPATGYVVSRSSSGDHVVIDAGPHGYLNGGHAHADALSLTLSIRMQPLLVDAGTATYTADAGLRDRFRSTAAHNTVVLDDRWQSEPDGPFQWIRAANGRTLRWQTGPQFDYFEGVHDGYAPVEHRRHVFVLHGTLLVVADCIAGSGTHRADVHWHVHPAWQVSVDSALVRLTSAADEVSLACTAAALHRFSADVPTGLGWYSPAYGRIEPLTTLRWRQSAAAPFWICTAFGLDRFNPVAGIEARPLYERDAAGGAAFRIWRTHGLDEIAFAHPSPSAAVWRSDDVESDARVLYCHRTGDGVNRLALVDAARVRLSGTTPVEVRCVQPVRGMHVALSQAGAGVHRLTSSRRTARVHGANPGVQLRVGDDRLVPAPERRSHVRASNVGRP